MFYFSDSPIPWALSLQDSASPIFEGITELHGTLIFYLILIALSVFWVLFSIIISFTNNKFSLKYLTHGTILELIWTITPAFILIAIAFPSFRLLYLLDEVLIPALTIKIIGNQWYWTVEYSDYSTLNNNPINFDVYIIPENDLVNGDLRLLSVDNNIVLPVGTHVRFIVTGSDVIHNFACPSLGLKVDAIPGRLNQASTLLQRTGWFYGQCSELCGVYHSFIPICIQSVNLEEFLLWLTNHE